jgi:anaerobic magnesium-protoporphyrin IX monomethyl ester cyclase
MAYWNEDAISEVALIDPAGFDGALRRRRPGRKLIPHMGLGYVAASLERNGERVRVLDAGVATHRELQRFLSQPANLFGLSAVSFTFREAVRAARAVKQRYASVPVLLGGPHASIDPAGCLAEGAVDYALRGEAEDVIIDLVEVFKRRTDPTPEVLGRVPGLVWRQGGEVRINPAVPRVQRLDDLPFPAWHLFPMGRYQQHPILTSRGCPISCSFCAVETVWGRQWVRRDPEQVASEVAWLQRHWGRKLVHVNDDNLTLDARHVAGLCAAFQRQRLNVNWVAQGVRADALTAELTAQMRRSGCHRVSLGIESADPAVLQAIGKQETVEDVARAVRLCQAAGIQVLGMFMVGNPGESEAAVESSLAFAARTRIDLPAFYMAIPYPTTRLWTYVTEQGRFLNPDYLAFTHDSSEPVFDTPEFPAEARRRVFARAQRYCRRRLWAYHLTFWWPPRLWRRNAYEIGSELKLLFKALGWPWRRLARSLRRKEVAA